MAVLHVSMFGGMKVTRNPYQNTIKLTRTSQMILAYLLLGRQRQHSREILSELFWGDLDQDHARHCLNTALWRLRSTFKNEQLNDSYLLVSDSGEIGFNASSDFWFDVAIFEECVNRIKRIPFDQVRLEDVQELETKTQLYVGELLEGIYTDWAIRAREYERMLYLDGLKYLMGYYRSQYEPLRSLEYGQKILELDPLREDIHREMMRLYQALGQRSSAILQYEQCCKSLHTELGITPLEETRQLYDQIAAQGRLSLPAPAAQPAPDLQEALALVQQAACSFALAQEQFQTAMQRMQQYIQRNGGSG